MLEYRDGFNTKRVYWRGMLYIKAAIEQYLFHLHNPIHCGDRDAPRAGFTLGASCAVRAGARADTQKRPVTPGSFLHTIPHPRRECHNLSTRKYSFSISCSARFCGRFYGTYLLMSAFYLRETCANRCRRRPWAHPYHTTSLRGDAASTSLAHAHCSARLRCERARSP